MAFSEAEPRELTIDELARTVGMTVRNVRAYASRGLLPPPRLVGRTGYYGDEHVARLTLVRELLAEGYTLAAVERIVGGEFSAVTNALAVLQALRMPWKPEDPEIVDLTTLQARGGGTRDEVSLEELVSIGLVEPLEDGRVRVLQPSLLAAGIQVVRLGISGKSVIAAYPTLARQAREVAETFVALFRESVWRDFAAAGMPESDLPRVQSVVENLHPAAVQALVAMFRSAMAEAIDETISIEVLNASDTD